ncbi:MAG: cell division protein FtsQ/DivIB [[Clostridium] leptum]
MEKKEKKRVYSARRNKYRKLKIGVLYTVMILAILTAGIAIGATVLFKIDTIQVVGESRYDPQEIISLSGVEKGENLITIDTAEGEAAIMSRMPYLETVRIKRKIPSTVNIEVTEAQAAGCIAYQNQYVIISGSDKVLELAQAPLERVYR